MSKQVHRFMVAALAICSFYAARSAVAESPVYADIAGTCAGLAPCYDTITQAVDGASDPDGAGPLFAEIYVFPGVYPESVDLSNMDDGEQGDLQMIAVNAAGEPEPGTVMIDPPAGWAIKSSIDPELGDAAPFAGHLILDGFVVTSPDVDAINVYIVGDFVARNIDANFAGDIDDLSNETGIQAKSLNGDIEAENCHATGNRGDGFFLVTEGGDVTVDNCTAVGNKDGFDIESARSAVVTNCSATGGRDNEENGLPDGFEVQATFSAYFENVFALNNDDDGFEVDCTGDVVFRNVAGEQNGDNGFEIELDGALTMERVTARTNGLQGSAGDGIDVDEETTDLGVASITIVDSFVEGNHNNGLLFEELIEAGEFRVQRCIICSNGKAGVELRDTTATVDMTANLWGAFDGPTHPNNPAGTGDAAADEANGGAGKVVFDPWIDEAIATASADAVNLGDSATVQFQFRHSGGEALLGQGPGADNGEPPFTLSTDNGKVATSEGDGASVGAFFVEKGIVEAIVSPDAEGTATVDLIGPCIPKLSVAFAVNTPPAPTPPPPFCGAGVSLMATLSAVGLCVLRFGGSRRRRAL